MDVTVKFGDIWQIGKHKLLCGDASEKVMVDELMDGKLPVLMVTDPPYGVNYTTFSRKKANRELNDNDKKKSLEEIKIRNDHRASWSKVFLLSNAQIAYVWHPSSVPDVCMQALRDGMYQVRQSIIWAKNRPALSRSAYHWQHESCLYAVRLGETANWKGDRKQRTLWNEPTPEPKDRIHPTQKPVGLYIRPINNHTDPDDLVYDPFAGSGVVFSACQETGRTGIGVEIEPAYCQKIIKKWQEKRPEDEVVKLKNLFDELEKK